VDALEGDDGQATAISERQLTAPSRPGIYFLRHGAERAGALVVNAEPEESDLRRLAPRALGARLRARETVVTPDEARWRREAFDVGARRPLQPSLLLLALLCLAAELFVVRRDDRPRLARAA
jgi:hypothetical protein